MSVRHKVRERVEKLFSKFKDTEGEFTVYSLYAPSGRESIDAHDLNYLDMKIDLKDQEAVKKFLDRVTRETLENEVKGYYLLGMVMDKGDTYIFSSDMDLLRDLSDEVKDIIEKLKEE